MAVRPIGVNHRDRDPASGGSELLDAINRGQLHLTKFVLDAMDGRTDVVNTRDFNGKTPLIRACYVKEESTRTRIVQLLLHKRADVNIQDDSGRTALSYACELRCNDIVMALVKNNVNPDIGDRRGRTPLMYSAMAGNDKAIEILLKCFRRLGLDVNRENDQGQTALIISAKLGHLACAGILARGRADTEKVDPETGLTAEEWARSRGCSTPDVAPFSHATTKKRGRRRPSEAGYKNVSKSRSNVNSRKKPSFERTDKNVETSYESVTDLRLNANVTVLRQPLTKLGTKEGKASHEQRLNISTAQGCHFQSELPELNGQRLKMVNARKAGLSTNGGPLKPGQPKNAGSRSPNVPHVPTLQVYSTRGNGHNMADGDKDASSGHLHNRIVSLTLNETNHVTLNEPNHAQTPVVVDTANNFC